MKVSFQKLSLCFLVLILAVCGCQKSGPGNDILGDLMADTGVQPDGDVVPDQFDEGVYLDSGDSIDSETAEAVDIKELCSEGKDCAELCEGGQVLCITGECHECCIDSDCEPVAGSAVVCSSAGVCEIVPPCGGLCGAELPYCAVVSGVEQCVQCQTDNDCTGISSACSCKETAGWSCVMQHGTACQEGVLQCDYPEDLPTIWGPVGVASYISVPGNDEQKIGCYDYTADGDGDFALSGLASQINPLLTDLIADRNTAILMEFKGVDDVLNNSGFSLYIVSGTPSAPEPSVGDVYIDTEDYLFNQDTCEPAFKLDGRIVGGILVGSADKITVQIYVSPEMTLSVDVTDLHISANIIDSGAGIEVIGGVLSGVLAKKVVWDMLDSLTTACGLDPQPDGLIDVCPLPITGNPEMILDMHRMDDGTYVEKDSDNPGNATSICIKFGLVSGRIVGYRP